MAGPRIGGWVISLLAAMTLAACDRMPLSVAWEVDVINGPTPTIVSITTESASWAWLVPANAKMVLLDLQQSPTEGELALISPDDCQILQRISLPAGSFTIVEADAGGDGPYAVQPGAPLVGRASSDYWGACSG